jgi:hypothetical protein
LSIVDYAAGDSNPTTDIEILQDYRIPSLAIYATYLQRRFLPAKLTTFVDFMVKYFAENKA